MEGDHTVEISLNSLEEPESNEVTALLRDCKERLFRRDTGGAVVPLIRAIAILDKRTADTQPNHTAPLKEWVGGLGALQGWMASEIEPRTELIEAFLQLVYQVKGYLEAQMSNR